MEKEPQYSKEENEQIVSALRYMEEVRLRTFSIGELKNMLIDLDRRDENNEKIMDQYLKNGQVIDFCRDSITDLLEEYGIPMEEEEL